MNGKVPIAPFVGAIVQARDAKETVLRCGSKTYGTAVCVSLCPFVLVSIETDMLWGNYDIGAFEAVAAAGNKLTKQCVARLVRDIRIGVWTRPNAVQITAMFKG